MNEFKVPAPLIPFNRTNTTHVSTHKAKDQTNNTTKEKKPVKHGHYDSGSMRECLSTPTKEAYKLPRTESLSNAENNDPKSSTTPIRGNSFANRLMAAGVKSPGTPFPNSTDTNVNPLRGTKRHAAKNSNFSHGVSSALNSGIYESDETRKSTSLQKKFEQESKSASKTTSSESKSLFATSSSSIETLSDNLDSLTLRNPSSQTRNTSSPTAVRSRSFETMLTATKSESMNAMAELKMANERLNAILALNTDLTKKLENEKKRTQRLELDLQEREKEISTSESEIKDLQSELSQLKRVTITIRTDLTERLQAESEKTTKLTMELDTERKLVAAMRDENCGLVEDINALKKELKATKSLLRTSENELVGKKYVE